MTDAFVPITWKRADQTDVPGLAIGEGKDPYRLPRHFIYILSGMVANNTSVVSFGRDNVLYMLITSCWCDTKTLDYCNPECGIYINRVILRPMLIIGSQGSFEVTFIFWNFLRIRVHQVLFFV